MKIWTKIVSSVLACAAFVSCTKEAAQEGGVPPKSGAVEYEITYSKDIHDDLTIGQFLPRKLQGEYNSHGIKMGASFGLGMIDLNVVFTNKDSYMELALPDMHMLLPIEKFVIQDSIDAHINEIIVDRDDNMVDVMGYQSKKLLISLTGSKEVGGKEFGPGQMEVFYAPLPDVDHRIAGLPQFSVPGLITAMKLISDDSSVMFMLSKLKEKEVDDNIFVRPAGAKEVDLDVVMGLGEKLN